MHPRENAKKIWPHLGWLATAALLLMGDATAFAQVTVPDGGGVFNWKGNDGDASDPDHWTWAIVPDDGHPVPGQLDVVNIGSTTSPITVGGNLNVFGAGIGYGQNVVTMTGTVNAAIDGIGADDAIFNAAVSTTGGISTSGTVTFNAPVDTFLGLYASHVNFAAGSSLTSMGTALAAGEINFSGGATGSSQPNAASSGPPIFSNTTALEVRGTMSIDGSGTSFTANGDTIVGTLGADVAPGSFGTIGISNGGKLVTSGTTYLGVLDTNYLSQTSPGSGVVIVTGSGSTWEAKNDIRVSDADNSFGSVNIQGGAILKLDVNADIRLGSASAGGFGVLTFDGTGGNPELMSGITNALIVGDQSYGILNIQNGASITHGGMIDVGNTQNANGTISIADSASSLTCNGPFIVGDGGTGALNITGGTVTSNGTFSMGGAGEGNGSVSLVSGGTLSGKTNMYIGNFSGGSGTITVGQPSAMSAGTLTAGGVLNVGEGGVGEVDVYNGTVTCNGKATNNLVLGDTSTGVGTVNLTGSNASISAGSVVVGNAGIGTMSIQSGAQATFTGALIVAAAAGSSQSSTVTISGAGTTAMIGGNLIVGGQSTGSLTLTKSAQLNVKGSMIDLGQSSGSNGTLTLDGAGTAPTLLTADNTDVIVGDAGTGELEIANAAMLTVNDEMTVGNQAGSKGIVTVGSSAQQSSTLTVKNTLIVGEAGPGELNINNGSVMADSINPSLIIGDQAHTGNGAVVVSGTMAKLTAAGMEIGSSGTGALTVQGGGTVHASGPVVVGATTGSTGTITLNDDNSILTIDDTLTLGAAGVGTLNLNKGTLHDTADVAVGATGNGSTTGTGIATVAKSSTWRIDGNLTIGQFSGGTGMVTVQDGGTLQLNGTTLVLGQNMGSNGTLTMSGLGSELTGSDGNSATGKLVIGKSGSGTLNVLNSAVVNIPAAVTLGAAAGSSGTVVVDGSSGAGTSTFTTTVSSGSGADSLVIGGTGTGELDIRNGAAVNSVSNGVTIASQASSTGTVNFSGATSTWSIGLASTGSVATPGNLIVGGAGAKATLNLSNDANLVVNNLTVDQACNQAQVNVTNGGMLESGMTTIGATSGQGTVLVSGLASQWKVHSMLTVGNGGTGAVQINAAAHLNLPDSLEQLNVGGSGGSGTVTINGGSLDGDSEINVGYAGQGTVMVEGGGTLTADALNVGHEGVGDLQLSGASTGTTSSLTVGESVGAGSVTLSGGSQLNSDDTSIGFSSSGLVSVTDGSKLTMHGLGIGNFASGTLLIDGATSTVSSNLPVSVGSLEDGPASGTGSIGISGGGNLTVTSPNTVNIGDTANGTLSVSQGSANLYEIEIGNHGTVSLSGSNSTLSVSSSISVGSASGSGANSLSRTAPTLQPHPCGSLPAAQSISVVAVPPPSALSSSHRHRAVSASGSSVSSPSTVRLAVR